MQWIRPLKNQRYYALLTVGGIKIISFTTNNATHVVTSADMPINYTYCTIIKF